MLDASVSPTFIKTAMSNPLTNPLWQTQQVLWWGRKDLTPFREALLVYTSNQSLKGQCPHLAVPPWTQIKGMQSDVYATKFGFLFFFFLSFITLLRFMWQIVTAELQALGGSWKGERSLGCDLQVLLRLFRFWIHIKQRVKYVQLGCEKLGKDQITVSLQRMEKSIYLSQQGIWSQLW